MSPAPPKHPKKVKRPVKPASKISPSLAAWYKAHPLPNDFKAWAKAHPLPSFSSKSNKQSYAAWVKAHPFPNTPLPPFTAAQTTAYNKANPLPPFPPSPPGMFIPGPTPSPPAPPTPPVRVPKPRRVGVAGTLTESDWLTGMNDKRGTCAMTAVANSLAAATGIRLTNHEILGAGEDITVENALHYAISLGLELDAMWQEGSPAVLEPGYLLLLKQASSYHAALYAGDGDMVTWGAVAPLDGKIVQAWDITWRLNGVEG